MIKEYRREKLIISMITKTKTVTGLRTTMPLVFRIVFRNNPYLYTGIAAVVFTIFWVIFNLFDRLLFFSPIVTFYLPDDAIIGFIITNITAVLMGILVAMNVYIFRNSKLKLDKSSFSGSVVGIASCACASCSSIGFLIISTFGGFGIVATDLLTNYQTPLRIISIVILLWALYSVHNKIAKSSCILEGSSSTRQDNNTTSIDNVKKNTRQYNKA